MKSRKTPDEEAEHLAESLEQALRYLQGDPSGVTVHRFTIKVPDVARLRSDLGLTQDELAVRIGVPVATLRNWEQKRRHPTGPARVLLNILEREPKTIMAMIAAVEQTEAVE